MSEETKKIGFKDLTKEEQHEIAGIAMEFAKHQAEIDHINDRLKGLVDEKKALTSKIEANRERYTKLEASMVSRIGGKFELVIEDGSLLAAMSDQAVK